MRTAIPSQRDAHPTPVRQTRIKSRSVVQPSRDRTLGGTSPTHRAQAEHVLPRIPRPPRAPSGCRPSVPSMGHAPSPRATHAQTARQRHNRPASALTRCSAHAMIGLPCRLLTVNTSTAAHSARSCLENAADVETMSPRASATGLDAHRQGFSPRAGPRCGPFPNTIEAAHPQPPPHHTGGKAREEQGDPDASPR